MSASNLVDLSNQLGPVHRFTADERATIRTNSLTRFGAVDGGLLVAALGCDL